MNGADSRTVDAVVRNLEIIGEAARAIPVENKQDRPAIDWSALNGLRNRIVRETFGASLPSSGRSFSTIFQCWMFSSGTGSKSINEPRKLPISGAVDPLARQQLEMKRGVLGVRLEQPEVLVGKIANISRQGPVAAPEPARCRVVHRGRRGWLR